MTMFVKIALLVIISRVFGIAHHKTRMFIYGLLAVIVGYYVSGVIVKICICDPISAYWKGDTSKCLDQSAIITTDAIASVISDLAILCLPIPLTWSLQMPAKKKLRITGILCAGGTATAFSIYRLGMILHEGKSPNQSIVFVKVILTGYVTEISVYMWFQDASRRGIFSYNMTNNRVGTQKSASVSFAPAYQVSPRCL